MAQQFANQAQAILTTAYTAGDTTIYVANGAVFPSSGNFTLAMGYPVQFYLVCTAISGNTVTVTGTAQEGTSTANLPIGTTITQVVTAAVITGLKSDIVSSIPTTQMGTYANFLTLGGTQIAGNKYKCTDGPYEFIHDGTKWQPFLFGHVNCVDPIQVYNQSTTVGTAITSTGSTSIVVAANFGTMPSLPFRIRIDTEQLSVTSYVGTTWTVVRGDGGTPTATHLAGATIMQMNWFVKYSFGGCNFIAPGNGTCIYTTDNAGSQEWVFGMYQPLPASAANYTVTLAYAPYSGQVWANYISWGVNIYDEPHNTSTLAVAQFFNGVSTFAGYWTAWAGGGYAWAPGGQVGYPTVIPQNTGVIGGFHPYTPFYTRIVDDGTLLKYYYSYDGWNFILTQTVPRTTVNASSSHFGPYISGRNNWHSNILLGCRVTTP